MSKLFCHLSLTECQEAVGFMLSCLRRLIWGYIQKFPDWVDNEINNNNDKHSLRSNTKGYGCKNGRVTHKIAIQLHLLAESCTICSSRSRWPVRKFLYTPSCVCFCVYIIVCYLCVYVGVLGFDSRRGLGIFLFTTVTRTALGPTQPPIQWVPRALSLGVKRPVREADHSPPSSAEVKEWVELYIHSPNTPSWCGA
jgi:hypothetical protein